MSSISARAKKDVRRTTHLTSSLFRYADQADDKYTLSLNNDKIIVNGKQTKNYHYAMHCPAAQPLYAKQKNICTDVFTVNFHHYLSFF